MLSFGLTPEICKKAEEIAKFVDSGPAISDASGTIQIEAPDTSHVILTGCNASGSYQCVLKDVSATVGSTVVPAGAIANVFKQFKTGQVKIKDKKMVVSMGKRNFTQLTIAATLKKIQPENDIKEICIPFGQFQCGVSTVQSSFYANPPLTCPARGGLYVNSQYNSLCFQSCNGMVASQFQILGTEFPILNISVPSDVALKIATNKTFSPDSILKIQVGERVVRFCIEDDEISTMILAGNTIDISSLIDKCKAHLISVPDGGFITAVKDALLAEKCSNEERLENRLILDISEDTMQYTLQAMSVASGEMRIEGDVAPLNGRSWCINPRLTNGFLKFLPENTSIYFDSETSPIVFKNILSETEQINYLLMPMRQKNNF